VLPAARQTTNPTYEYAVVDTASGKLVPVSIKSGHTPVDVGLLASTAGVGGRTYAYSAEGH
jgi:hypothetical protein